MTTGGCCSVSLLAIFQMFCYGMALGSLCSDPMPVREKAYNGAFKLEFPDLKQALGQPTEPSKCSWLIEAYRKEYVVRLRFDDVNLVRHEVGQMCDHAVTVYDGPTVAAPLLVSFCGQEAPDIVTSTRLTLVVFSSQSGILSNGSFTVLYTSVKDRGDTQDSGKILRIVFGGFIGSIALVVIFSGICRKCKRSGPRSLFPFGQHRVTSESPTSRSANSRRRRAAQRRAGTGRQPNQPSEERTAWNRISVFFQGVIQKVVPRPGLAGSSSANTSSSSAQQQQQLQQQQQQQQQSQIRQIRSGSINAHTHLTNCTSVSHDVSNSELDIPTVSHFHSDLDHDNFGYQAIPVSSFTSDPEAVKPPTYEDCVKNVNIIYLQHMGSEAYYNTALDLKDEANLSVQILSPPPPYSEVNEDRMSSDVPEIASTTNTGTCNTLQSFPTFNVTENSATTQRVNHNNMAAVTSHPLAPYSGAENMTPVSINLGPILSSPSACTTDSSVGIATRSSDTLERAPVVSNRVDSIVGGDNMGPRLDDQQFEAPPNYDAITAGHACPTVQFTNSSTQRGPRDVTNQSAPPLLVMQRAGFLSSRRSEGHWSTAVVAMADDINNANNKEIKASRDEKDPIAEDGVKPENAIFDHQEEIEAHNGESDGCPIANDDSFVNPSSDVSTTITTTTSTTTTTATAATTANIDVSAITPIPTTAITNETSNSEEMLRHNDGNNERQDEDKNGE